MSRPSKPPELYVVGAGPGDPELLTLKAYRLLQTADVILYDNLANQELLTLVPAACECHYVGKKPYGEYTPQEVIHQLIKEKAFEKGRVLRLKGGDPFIFGRGFEEILFARAHGIAAHYVPGISSMQAIGFEDVPLTHRQVSEGFWVLTGTKRDGSLSADLRLAMQSNSTVVIYMDIKCLSQIVATYEAEDRGDTPATVVMHASLPHRRSVVGTVRELPTLVKAAGITYPALILIGNVVSLSQPGVA